MHSSYAVVHITSIYALQCSAYMARLHCVQKDMYYIYTASANITPATRDHLHCGSVQIWRAACRYGTQLHAHCFGTFITHKHTEYDWQSTTRHTVCVCTLTLTTIHPLSCFVNHYFLEFLFPSVVSLSLSLTSFHC